MDVYFAVPPKAAKQPELEAKSKLSFEKWLLLIYWVRKYSVTQAGEEAEVSPDTAVDMYQWLREVYSTKIMQTLGGQGRVVHIDESLFKHKPKVHCTQHNLKPCITAM